VRGGRCDVTLRVPLADGGTATLLAGRDFLLDAECVAQVEALPGVIRTELAQMETRLQLVG
jgi:DNA polymerase-3 subunit alpha